MLLLAIAALLLLSAFFFSNIARPLGRPLQLAAAALFAVIIFAGVAHAADAVAQAPVADGLLGGVVSLWGPFLGLIAAIILLFDRIAKVIPNSTTSTILSVLQKIATVLGVKVPDVK